MSSLIYFCFSLTVSCSADMSIKLWDFTGYDCIRTMHGKERFYFSLVLFPRSTLFLFNLNVQMRERERKRCRPVIVLSIFSLFWGKIFVFKKDFLNGLQEKKNILKQVFSFFLILSFKFLFKNLSVKTQFEVAFLVWKSIKCWKGIVLFPMKLFFNSHTVLS